LIGDQCGAHTVPYIEAKNSSTVFEHEATTSKISEDILLHAARTVQRKAVALVVNGFVKDVLQQLPMEFAAEAQSLISLWKARLDERGRFGSAQANILLRCAVNLGALDKY
jgi:Fe-S cluster assembly protein SufB